MVRDRSQDLAVERDQVLTVEVAREELILKQEHGRGDQQTIAPCIDIEIAHARHRADDVFRLAVVDPDPLDDGLVLHAADAVDPDAVARVEVADALSLEVADQANGGAIATDADQALVGKND